MRRIASGIVFVVVAVAIGKACQYAAVGLLGARLGFAGASQVGLTPFLAALLLLRARWRA